MFGMPCVKIGGKAFVGLYQGSLVVKIGRERVEKMLKAKTGRQFDPSGMGRPMKEWVAIEEPESGRPKKWLALAEEAKAFVAGSAPQV
jgi:hypothetical protein